MITRKQIEKAFERCIRRACGNDNGEWYAVTLWSDGHFEHRGGIGPMTYGEDEYYRRPNSERTLFVMHGIPDIDPESEWVDPDTGELDEEEANHKIIEDEMEMIDWRELEAQVRKVGHEYSADDANVPKIIQPVESDES